MRVLIFICLLFIGCKTNKVIQPSNITRCLRTTLLPDADPGGWWKIINQPTNSIPINFPTKNSPGADNPCINLANYGCGQYQFKYYVESNTCTGCVDSSDIIVINYTKTLIGLSTCN